MSTTLVSAIEILLAPAFDAIEDPRDFSRCEDVQTAALADPEERLHRDIEASGDLSLGEAIPGGALEDLDLGTLELAAERAGFVGDVLPDVTDLPAHWVATICRAWLDGLDQRRDADREMEDRYSGRGR